jgi:cadmium resistance protein CadD (predicted permease)
LLLVAGGFAASNLDNLLLLTALSAVLPFAQVALGLLLSVVAMLLFLLAGCVLGSLLEPAFMGYLGVVPLFLGIRRGLRALRTAEAGVVPAERAMGAWGVGVLMVANSGDTLVLLLPLFADTGQQWLPAMFLTYLAMACLWLALVRLLLTRQPLVQALVRHERWLLPAIMVGVGLFVLMDTTADRLL